MPLELGVLADRAVPGSAAPEPTAGFSTSASSRPPPPPLLAQLPPPPATAASWLRQVHYGPNNDKSHHDVSSLADLHQWIQVSAKVASWP